MGDAATVDAILDEASAAKRSTDAAASASHDHATDAAASASHRDDGSSPSSLLPPRRALPPVLTYALLALADIMCQEFIPLFCFAPVSSGGLGLDVSAVGLVLTVTGVAITLFQLVGLPLLLARTTSTRLLKAATVLAVPVVVLMPHVCLAPLPLRAPLFVVLVCVFKSLAAGFYTASFMLINNSVPPSHRGGVNGLAMTAASISRGVGPVVSATLFAWSLTNGLHVPGLGVRFAFLVTAAMMGVAGLYALRTLDPSYDMPPPARADA